MSVENNKEVPLKVCCKYPQSSIEYLLFFTVSTPGQMTWALIDSNDKSMYILDKTCN